MKRREIKIGALYPLSGSEKPVGESIYKALEFYTDIVNNQDTIDSSFPLSIPNLRGNKIKLIWADTEGDSSTALREARHLIEDENVAAIIGSYQSTVSSSVSFLTEVLKVPYVSAETDAGILAERNLKWFFKVGTNDITYTKALLYMLEENNFGDSDFACLAEDTLLGQEEVESVINMGSEHSYPVVDTELYGREHGAVQESLCRIKKVNPDFIFCGQAAKQPVETIEDLKRIKFYPMGLLDQTGEYTLSQALDTLGEKANYVISAVPWAPGVDKVKPVSKKINAMFKNIYGSGFDTVNSASFTGIYVLIDAIARSRNYSRNNIRKALINTHISPEDIIMPWGGVEFDEYGMNVFASSIITQIYNHALKIVWPRCLAEEKVVLPVPQWNE